VLKNPAEIFMDKVVNTTKEVTGNQNASFTSKKYKNKSRMENQLVTAGPNRDVDKCQRQNVLLGM
jgi:hypothetical protein